MIKSLITYYCFIIVTAMTVIGLISAATPAQLVSAMLFFPLTVYFALAIWPRQKKSLREIRVVTKEPNGILRKIDPSQEPQPVAGEMDPNRRLFLKLIGSAGISLFLMTIFTKRTEAAFFGSVPGPGTVSLKDSAGNKIDPAEKQPTDGYKITEIDDASSPAYYGFVEKGGAWYIQREDSSGAYRYAKGSSAFSTGWTGRAALSYDYFDNVF